MSSRFARLHGIIIGIDRYLPAGEGASGGYQNLAGCVNDARKIAHLLIHELGAPPHQIDLLVAPDPPEANLSPTQCLPSSRQLIEAFRRLEVRARPGDAVWIHHSGHGGQAPTAFPEIKGSSGRDEVLVPFDIGNQDSSYLRDVELGYVLERLVRRGLLVTLFLDSCHAGGMTRNGLPNLMGLRERSNSVKEWKRPASGIGGVPRAELLASWQRFSAPWNKASVPVGGYVLMAACRPHERAHEYETDPGMVGGALTSEFLVAIREMGPDATYRQCFDRIRARIRQRFEGFQTPVLEGETNRILFGSETGADPPSITVLAVEDQRVLLATGEAQGIAVGALFTVHPLSGRDSQAEFRPSLLKLSELGASESWACYERGSSEVVAGDRAIPSDFGIPRRRARWSSSCGEPPSELRKLINELRGLGNPLVVWTDIPLMPGDPPGFELSLDHQGSIVISGDRLNPLPRSIPPLPPTDWIPSRILSTLERLAKFQAIESLQNRQPSPALEALEARLGRLPTGFRPGLDPFDGAREEGNRILVRPGDWILLTVENRSQYYLEVAVLDLTESWAIEQLFPAKGDTMTIEAGLSLKFPLQARLSVPRTNERHLLRVFATLDPVRWHWMTLPPLDQPIVGAREGSPRNRLEYSLQGFLNGGAGQDVAAHRSRDGSREWSVSGLEIEICDAEEGPDRGPS